MIFSVKKGIHKVQTPAFAKHELSYQGQQLGAFRESSASFHHLREWEYAFAAVCHLRRVLGFADVVREGLQVFHERAEQVWTEFQVQDPEWMPAQQDFGDEGSYGGVLRGVYVPSDEDVNHVLEVALKPNSNWEDPLKFWY